MVRSYLDQCIPLVFHVYHFPSFIACLPFLSFLGLDCLSLGYNNQLTLFTFYTLSIRATSSRISYLYIVSRLYGFAIYLVNGLYSSICVTIDATQQVLHRGDHASGTKNEIEAVIYGYNDRVIQTKPNVYRSSNDYSTVSTLKDCQVLARTLHEKSGYY